MTSCLLVADRLLFIFAVARMFAAKPAAFFKVGGCGSELNFAIKGPGTNHAVVRNLFIVPSASSLPRRKK